MKEQTHRSSHDTIRDDLFALLTEEEKTHLLNGAYLLIDDHGLYYSKWIGLRETKTRLSSHHSTDLQWSVNGNELFECLFATRQIDGKQCTWLQLERYSREYSQLIQHSASYLYYLFTGKNVGPRGVSHYTEGNPLRINRDRIKPELILKELELEIPKPLF